MKSSDIIHKLKESLRGNLPGTDIQWEMASSDRRIEGFPRTRGAESKLAAVLILLYPVGDTLMTLFIQRPVYDGVHSGQISFPGGKREESDRDLVDTAIREACEETGICGDNISILGTLTPLFIPVSNIEVTPVIGFVQSRPEFSPSNEEVMFLIEADLSRFSNPGIIKEKPMRIRDQLIDVKYYDLDGHVIWGATAMILYELTVIMERDGISLSHTTGHSSQELSRESI